MINSVTIAGYVTRKPELRTTKSGTAVLSFGVAVNERVKNNQTGEWTDRANFFECVMFGKRAESVAQYITKGTYVVIQGHLRYSSWEQDGKNRSKVEIIVDDIDFKSTNGAPQPAQQPQSVYVGVFEPQTSMYDADIPF